MVQALNVAWIRLFKWLFILAVIVGVGYILNFIFKNQNQPNRIPQEQEGALQGQETAQDTAPTMENLSAVLEQRDIFASKTALELAPLQALASPTGELPGNLKVVGILIGKPSQVIIEDVVLRQTYFINEGETQGGIRLERVEVDKVVINYSNQEIAIKINQARAGSTLMVNPIINNVQIP